MKQPSIFEKIDIRDFLVKHNYSLKLNKCSTIYKPLYKSDEEYEDYLRSFHRKLNTVQEMFYADGRFSFLFVFQGMDTSGKDGAIKHVMSGLNPQGCEVHSFKQPTEEELKHDFLWRSNKNLPEKGKIGIFNRSYYEEVGTVRVHRKLLDSEKTDRLELRGIWKRRFKDINAFEKHLFHNGTIILKFFLHISKQEQRNRLIARIKDPTKIWKFSDSDIQERRYWSQYMDVYSDCLRRTSIKQAPWFLIPADDKKNARLIISKIILDHFTRLKLKYPGVSKKRRKDLSKIKKLLEVGKL